MIVVSDTSPISNLLQIGEIDLLRKLFERVVIPNTVLDEICRIEAHRRELLRLPWIEVIALAELQLRDRLIDEPMPERRKRSLWQSS